MALTDLSKITGALINLLKDALRPDVRVSQIDFSAGPPNGIQGSMPNLLNIYLFHAMEDPHGKNFTPVQAMGAAVPVQQTPLAFCLYYLVTATSFESSGDSAVDIPFTEQKIMGLVARAFHNYPVINDGTKVPADNPTPILESVDLHGLGNEIQIILRPVTSDESINFWSSEQERLARFSLFYEVRVILFDTPKAESSAPPVLSVAEFVSVSDRVTITRTRSLLGFSLPPNHPLFVPGTPFRFFAASPARPTLHPPGALPAGVPPGNNRITFEGAGFQGDRVTLALEGPMAVGATSPTNRRIRISVSQDQNPSWDIDADGVQISFNFRTAVVDEEGTSFTLYPGIYRARVVVGNQISNETPIRFLEQSSADCPFSVSPQIRTVAFVSAAGAVRRYKISLYGRYLSDDLDISLTVNGNVMLRNADLSVSGHFNLIAAEPDEIDFSIDTSSVG